MILHRIGFQDGSQAHCSISKLNEGPQVFISQQARSEHRRPFGELLW